jgi:hypothetical protein
MFHHTLLNLALYPDHFWHPQLNPLLYPDPLLTLDQFPQTLNSLLYPDTLSTLDQFPQTLMAVQRQPLLPVTSAFSSYLCLSCVYGTKVILFGNFIDIVFSVADPDPWYPYVLGHPGYGSGFF